MAGGKRILNAAQHGLYPRNFARPVRWKVDQDYLSKLTPEERVWLAKFNEAYYDADYKSTWPLEQKRLAGREKNAALRDMQSALLPVPDGLPDSAAPPPTEPTPEYLDSQEYKAARARFRAELAPVGRRGPLAPPKQTWRYVAAKAGLERFLRKAEGGTVKVARVKVVDSSKRMGELSVRGVTGEGEKHVSLCLRASGFVAGDDAVVLSVYDFEQLCREANALFGRLGEA